MEILGVVAVMVSGCSMIDWFLDINYRRNSMRRQELERTQHILENHRILNQIPNEEIEYDDPLNPFNRFRYCPNAKCQILIEKISGCDQVKCICGNSFDWKKAKLYVKSIPYKKQISGLHVSHLLKEKNSELDKWVNNCKYDTHRGFGNDECQICLDDEPVKWRLKCGHELCQQCLLKILKTSKKCPYDESPQIDSVPVKIEKKEAKLTSECIENNQTHLQCSPIMHTKIPVYAFGLCPEERRSSETIYMSRINNAQLKFKVWT